MSFASDLDEVHRRHLPRSIAQTLRPGSVVGRVFDLQKPPSTPAVLELFVDEVVKALENGEPAQPAAIDVVLGVLAEVATGMRDKTAIRQVRPLIDRPMRRLFDLVPGPSNARRSLLEAYLWLGLSTHGLLPYFEGLKTEVELTEAAPALIELLKKASDDEHEKIAVMLRGFREGSLLSYALLARTGEMREEELVQFLRHASMEFARALADETIDDEDFAQAALEDRRHRLIRDQLDQFALAFSRLNEKVRSAYSKAVTQAKHYGGHAYDRNHRLLFFKLFERRKLAWDDRASWKEAAQALGPAPLTFYRYPSVPKDSRLEEFVGTGACNDNLD